MDGRRIEPGTYDDFRRYAAAFIQKCFRGFVRRREHVMRRRSAIVVQRWWRKISLRNASAKRIQSAWRSHSNRKIFRFYVELLHFRERGDPQVLLKCINPREATLADAAAGVHVRFRLGGGTFPPMIYYKIFTHRPVTDICSFSPREYCSMGFGDIVARHNNPIRYENATSSHQRDEWYHRFENNSWRPISERLLASEPENDNPNPRREGRLHHHVPSIRRQELVKARKQTKLKWIMKAYREGRREDWGGGSDDESLPGSEDDLMEWSQSLDYDAYLRDWMSLACSAGSGDNVPELEGPMLEDIPAAGFDFHQMCAAAHAPLAPFVGGTQ